LWCRGSRFWGDLPVIPVTAAQAVTFATSLRETSLARGESEGWIEDFYYPSSVLLVSPQLMRSTAFVPMRARVNGSDDLVGRTQLPRSGALGLCEPAGALRVRDAVVFGEILKIFVEGRARDACNVRVTLNQLARAMGYRSAGGRQRRLALAALERLSATKVMWREIRGGHEVRLTWRLLESYAASDPSDAAGSGTLVQISRETADLLEHGYVHYVDRQLVRRLVAADDLAARLWLFLECERHHSDFWHHPVFRSGLREAPRFRDTPVIAELTGLHRWAHPRQAAARLDRALAAIRCCDPGRYELRLEHGRCAGMYTLHARRFKRPQKRRSACG
jgi:hypothetical protein